MASPEMPMPSGGEADRAPIVLGIYYAEAVVAVFIVSV